MSEAIRIPRLRLIKYILFLRVFLFNANVINYRAKHELQATRLVENVK